MLQRVGRHPIALLVVFAVFVAGFYFFASWLDASDRQPESRGTYTGPYGTADVKTIHVGDQDYKEKHGLTTLLLMGIDKASTFESAGYQNGGQADFLRLVVIDESEKKTTQISIDRDSMAEVTVLSFLGKERGTRVLQLCLAHAFGDGKELSAEMQCKAVSRLFQGTEIDYYIAMNMDGIAILNDFVGGIEVTLQDDFSAYDPAMVPGVTLTLRGKQAVYYTRSRYYINDGTNAYRMIRQQDYIQKLSDKMTPMLRADKNYVITLYDELQDYLVSNLKKGRLVNLVWGARDYAIENITVPGEHILGEDGYIQYLVDEEKLQDIILNVFYDRV